MTRAPFRENQPSLPAETPPARPHRRSRRLLAALTVLSLGVAGLAAAGASAGPQVRTTDFTKRFAKTASVDRPLMRWWMPLAPLSPREIRRELTDIANSGFGGVEVGAFPVGADTAKYGWNSDSWNTAMETILKVAGELGLRVDFMVTASYPTGAPSSSVTPDEPGSEKELAWGAVKVAPGTTFKAAAPRPLDPLPAGVSEQDLQAVVVGRLMPGQQFDASTVGTPKFTTVDLDPSTLRVLPHDGAGNVVFQAPADGEPWVLTSYWLRGTGAEITGITDPTSYVVDHLSAKGTDAWIDLWEENLLKDTKAAKLIKKNGGALFEDSLHLTSYQLWTDDFADEFRKRRGYDITPYLPALLMPELNNFFSFAGYNADSSKATFEFGADSDLGQRVRNDYFETLTELYVDRHIKPMREWANQQGLKIRFQPSYGQSLEQSQAVYEIDIPETESFQHTNAVDAYRYISSAAHAADKPIISTECCAERGQGNAFGWDQTLKDVEKNFAGGVNQVVFHGYSYNESPDATWPGWLRFGQNSFSENYGRQPTWTNVRTIADYLTREQTVLREGRQKTDVAIYRHSYWDMIRGTGSHYYTDSGKLAGAGYSYGFASPDMLGRDDFVGEGSLDPTGAGYRALILDNETALPYESAKTLAKLAADGYPLIFVGQTPNRSDSAAERSRDAEIARLVTGILKAPNVRKVATTAHVPAALTALGVDPAAEPSAPTENLTVRRVSDESTLYYLYNPSTKTQNQTYTLTGEGAPYELDAWTGEITPIAEYESAQGGASVEITLEPEETTIIALSDAWAGSSGPAVTGTDADKAVYTESGGIALRALRPGSYEATLDNRKKVTATVSSVPAVSLADQWSLRVESWEQASGDDPYTIAKRPIERTLTAQNGSLPAWQAVSGLEDVSGVGTYTGSITVKSGWNRSSGATLDLGSVSDTFTVTINGKRVPGADRGNPVIEIGRYLHTGANNVAVTVGTTLRNRMRVITGPKATPSTADRQNYGLFGPVRITPYSEVPARVK